jgi:hypothetical protein
MTDTDRALSPGVEFAGIRPGDGVRRQKALAAVEAEKELARTDLTSEMKQIRALPDFAKFLNPTFSNERVRQSSYF